MPLTFTLKQCSSNMQPCLMNSPWRFLDITNVSVPEIIICKQQNCILDGNSKLIIKLLINGCTISTNKFTLNAKIPQLLESCCLLCCIVCTVHVVPLSPKSVILKKFIIFVSKKGRKKHREHITDQFSKHEKDSKFLVGNRIGLHQIRPICMFLKLDVYHKHCYLQFRRSLQA